MTELYDRWHQHPAHPITHWGTFLTISITLTLLVSQAITNTYDTAYADTSSIYVSQTGAGEQNGSSCANARAVSWFNNASNWGPGESQIGAGKTIYLCGTITSNLTLQGSGISNNYIIIDGTEATYSGTFNTSNRSWWKIQNVTWVDMYDGRLISITGGSNGIFDGNHSDNGTAGPIFIAQGSSLPNNITISNNYIRSTTVDSGGQYDIIASEGVANLVIEGNYLEMRTAGNDYHNDIVQTWEKGGSSHGPPRDWTIKNNWFVMNSSASNNRSWLMLEDLFGTNNIYGNVFLGIQGAGSGNGIRISGSEPDAAYNIFNNTFVAKNGSNNVLNLSGATNGTANIRNNIFHLQGQTAMTGNMTKNRSYNLWYKALAGGASLPSCTGITGEICGTDPLFTNYANNDFSLQASSSALGTGTNLGAPFNFGIAPGSSWPNPTLVERTGAWDRGAFAHNISVPPDPEPEPEPPAPPPPPPSGGGSSGGGGGGSSSSGGGGGGSTQTQPITPTAPTTPTSTETGGDLESLRVSLMLQIIALLQQLIQALIAAQAR